MLPTGKSVSVSVAVRCVRAVRACVRACVRAKLCAGAKGVVVLGAKADFYQFVGGRPAGRPAGRHHYGRGEYPNRKKSGLGFSI